MIHHISIAAENPRQVALVLAEILKGKAYDFPPNPGSYIVCPFDEYGSAIEIYPLGTELVPGVEKEALSFTQTAGKRSFIAVHAAISVSTSRETIEKIGAREGWRTVLCNRGPFHVIEFWVENWLMLEFLPADLATEYLTFTQSKAAEEFLGEPIREGALV